MNDCASYMEAHALFLLHLGVFATTSSPHLTPGVSNRIQIRALPPHCHCCGGDAPVKADHFHLLLIIFIVSPATRGINLAPNSSFVSLPWTSLSCGPPPPLIGCLVVSHTETTYQRVGGVCHASIMLPFATHLNTLT